MPLPLRALDRVLDPWAARADQRRVIATELFLMAVAEEPSGVLGADLIGERVHSALVPDAGVAVSWLVADEYVLLLRLRDLVTGDEWGAV